MAYSIGLTNGQRAERKLLITVATWSSDPSAQAVTYDKCVILGARTEDSSIEFNPDIETVTDILGINYTDLNKTQPQQSFDPAYILGGDDLMAHLNECALKNSMTRDLNGMFNVYIVEAYLSETTGTTTTTTTYRVAKHKGCSIIPSSLGGSDFVSMPFDVYFSNDITMGTVAAYDRTTLLAIETNFTADT